MSEGCVHRCYRRKTYDLVHLRPDDWMCLLQSVTPSIVTTDAVRNLGCYSDRHATGPTRVQLLLYGILSPTLDQQNPTPADTIRCLVLSRLDYCNGLIGGLNNALTTRLQRAQNSVARLINPTVWDGEIISRLINRVRRRDHITPYQPCETARSYRADLWSLHWLPINTRVTFKICTYMYKILHGLAPDYLNCAIARKAPTRALWPASDTTRLAVTGREQRSEGAALPWQTQPCGTFPKVCEINRDIGSFPKQKLKLTYLVYTTCLDDTDFYFMTLLCFKWFCLKWHFTL